MHLTTILGESNFHTIEKLSLKCCWICGFNTLIKKLNKWGNLHVITRLYAFTNIVTNNGLFFCLCLYVRPSRFSPPYESTILIIGQIGPFFHQNQQSKRQTCHYLTPVCSKQCLTNGITLTKVSYHFLLDLNTIFRTTMIF